MAKTGYINGSDLLLYIQTGGTSESPTMKAVGHCTSHTTTFTSETKDRAVKPAASAAMTAGLWKGKSVTGLSVSVSAEGLRFYDEAECGYADVLAAWKEGKSIYIKGCERNENGNDAQNVPSFYLSGLFVISSLEESAPAQDDATYSIQLENDGEVTLAPTLLT